MPKETTSCIYVSIIILTNFYQFQQFDLILLFYIIMCGYNDDHDNTMMMMMMIWFYIILKAFLETYI